MDDTRRTDRLIATATVAIVHLLLGWLLLRAGVVTLSHGPAGTDADALQVTWIASVPAAPTQRPPASRVAARVRPATPSTRALRSEPAGPITPTRTSGATAVPATTADPPLSATFIEQGLRSSPPLSSGADFAPSPLRNRIATLPGRDAHRFRMRDPVTPATVVESIGRLFGGGPSDPCPRLRDNIADLATGGDSAVLREALERRQSHCP